MRGNVLNKKGVYNRCKLTRLVIDSEWEEQTWRESWEPTEMEDVNEECIGESSKAKRKDPGRGEACKRRKVETEAGVVWGEGISSAGEERNKFLSSESTPTTERAGRQSTIKLLSGVEWLSRLILRGVVDDAVEVASSLAVTEGWEEWWGEESSQQRSSQRSRKEEKWLWRVLDELHIEERVVRRRK